MPKSRKYKTEEAAIEKYLVKKIESLGGLAWKFSSPGTVGVPDRIIMIRQLLFFVELKAPGESMRKIQEWRKTQLEREGFNVILIDSIEKADHLIDNIVNNNIVDSTNYIELSKRRGELNGTNIYR